MSLVRWDRANTRRRALLLAGVAAVVVFLAVAGMSFAYSASLARVTENAGSLHWTNASLGTAALTRAGLVQAVTFTDLEQRGLVGEEDVEFAMEELDEATQELSELQELGAGHVSLDELDSFKRAVRNATAHLVAGDVDRARSAITGEVEGAYMALARSLAAEHEQIGSRIERNTEMGNTLSAWVVFSVTLAVPATLIVVYFLLARRQMRAVRDRARLELEAERTINRAKDEFIAGLSHELRTPLTSIYGFAEVLGDGLVSGSEATRETGRVIATQAAEMTRMVDDLLVASRLDSVGVALEAVTTSVSDVIDSAVAPFERAGVEMRRESSDRAVLVDPGRLRHVLVNLLSNAVRHGAPPVSIEVESVGDAVVIEVWDHGNGVPPEQRARLFERFVHTGEAPLLTGSLGLGLAVASRLARLMDGEVRYQRTGERTCFSVHLPAAPRTAMTAGTTRSAREP